MYKVKMKKKDCVYCGVAVFITLFLLIIVYQLWNKNLNIPFIYNENGDGLGAIYSVKNLLEGNWYFEDPHLNAPHQINNYMQDYLLPLGIIKIISCFVKTTGLAVNLFWIITYILTTVATYALLRKIRCNYIISIMGSVIYSFLPYHYFRMYHFWLMGCYIVPIAVWIILDILNFKGEITVSNLKKHKMKMGLIVLFALLIGTNGIYYAVFTSVLLLSGAIVISIRNKKFANFLFAIICTLIMFFPIICFVMMPAIIMGGNIVSNIASSRSLYQMTVFALPLILLFSPIPEHRIDFISKFAENLYLELGINNEAYMVSLGIFMSVGLIISVLYLFCSKKKTLPILSQMGMLNIIAILWGITSGLNIFIGIFLTTSIRCWNRISIFIALFSLLSSCVVIQKYFDKIKLRRFVTSVGCFLIMICAVLDQTTSAFAHYSEYNIEEKQYVASYDNLEEEYTDLENYVYEIEKYFESDAMIFQYCPYKEQNTQFSKLKYALVSDSLKWSSTTVENEHSIWINTILSFNKTNILNILAVYDFDGIVLDRSWYSDTIQFEQDIKEFENLIGEKAIIDQHSNMYCFDIREYKEKLYVYLNDNNIDKDSLVSEMDELFFSGFISLDNISIEEGIKLVNNETKILKIYGDDIQNIDCSLVSSDGREIKLTGQSENSSTEILFDLTVEDNLIGSSIFLSNYDREKVQGYVLSENTNISYGKDLKFFLTICKDFKIIDR